MTNTDYRFLKACRREPVDATPVWFMRQAGRFMAEYRALREKYSILELIRTPERAVEVTLQPINAFNLDAAIIFADILPPLVGMGIGLEFVKGSGPVLQNPVRSPDDVDRLRTPPAEENLPFTLEAIRLARAELEGRVPLIGFSGAPFTLASYAIEGGSSRNYTLAKGFMFEHPDSWHVLMDKLSKVIGEYLVAQAEAGAQALQVFDSWAGALSPTDYREFVLPYTQRVIAEAQSTGVPVINFSTGTSAMLDAVAEAGGDVIGVDWRIELDRAWEIVGNDVALQGNLDPVALLAPRSELMRRTADVLSRAAGRPGHIFNLGHGILPTTPVENVAALADYVHEITESVQVS
jgi:uroporphyrinogen decarboxylase